MTTRLSKIARLPAQIREHLNRRLHNGELGRTILPWVNNLPETKQVLADLFAGKPVTHQNLSEWRHTGYQDWLMRQDRMAWYEHITEHDDELDKHDRCGDAFEAFSRYFLHEIGQAFKSMQQIKNPEARWARFQTLTHEFARLQNSYNWSRRVALEWEKFNQPFEGDSELEAQNEPKAGGASPSAMSIPASRSEIESNSDIIETQEIPTPKRQGAGALQDAPRDFKAQGARASILDCGSPLPLSHEEPEVSAPRQAPEAPPLGAPASRRRDSELETQNPKPETDIATAVPTPNSSTPKLANSQTPPPFVPIPPLSPTTPERRLPVGLPPSTAHSNHSDSRTTQHDLSPRSATEAAIHKTPPNTQTQNSKPHKLYSLPIRGRRFICVEG